MNLKGQRDETWSKYLPFDTDVLFQNQIIVKKEYEDDFQKIENKINQKILLEINYFIKKNKNIIEEKDDKKKILIFKKNVNINQNLIIPKYFNSVIFQKEVVLTFTIILI